MVIFKDIVRSKPLHFFKEKYLLARELNDPSLDAMCIASYNPKKKTGGLKVCKFKVS